MLPELGWERKILTESAGSLASRKRCDFENAETPRFQKITAIFLANLWVENAAIFSAIASFWDAKAGSYSGSMFLSDSLSDGLPYRTCHHLTCQYCEAADLLEAPKPRKITSISKALKSDFRGLPQSNPKSNPKSNFLARKVTQKWLFRVKTLLLGLFLGLLWGRPRKSLFRRFWDTFNFSGCRGF